MQTPQDIQDENRRLRRTMRDLVALSTLPSVWAGLPPDGIARSLVEVLLNTLTLDLVYARLTRLSQVVEVVRTPNRGDAAAAVAAAVAPLLNDERVEPARTIRDPFGAGTLHVAVTRFGISDAAGVVVAASRRATFPTEQERLLLGVGANQMATVIGRKRAEREREELLGRLQDADRRKDEFLATLAHELRNPLAPIRNAVQVMKMAAEPEAREEARTLIERQLGQMVRLVDDLMDVSRITRNMLELKTERVDLAQVVRSAVETSRPLIDQMGHRLTVELPPQPVHVEADPTRLAQVFLNLLNNSAKYTEPEGRIRLTAELASRAASAPGADVVVSVSDNGIGIPADMLPTVFDLFTQVKGGMSRSQGGLGIGLSLVKRLVEMHGGSITAHSGGPGQGSTFAVRLPVLAEESRPRPPGERREGAAPTSALRILIVDDNRDGADSLGMMLRLMGNDTRTAYDGEEGVAAAGEFRPDVVLLDIGLPKLNGHDACRRIRAEPWGTGMVLIALTGWGQEDDLRRSHDAGFDRHLVKPVDPDALMQLLAGLPFSGQAGGFVSPAAIP